MCSKKTTYFFFISIIFFYSINSLSQSVNVPLNHWAYDFFERLEVRGCFRSYLLRTRPITRMDIASIIKSIEDNKKVILSQAERDILEQLKGEFCEEVSSLNIESLPQYREKHLIDFIEKENQIKIDVDFSQIFDRNLITQKQVLSLTTLGGIVRGNLKRSLGFYLHFKNTLIKGDHFERENFNPQYGLPINISGKNVYQAEATAYILWKLPWFQFEFGHDQAQWGPGYQGSLMISKNNPLFDMVKITAQFKRFQFTSIHGTLASGIGRKYLATHRLEIHLLKWLFVAGAEAVIYGNRAMEFQYLNPLMLYHIAEQNLGNKDNNTISFEATLFPAPGHKIYGELFLDDYTTAENPLTYFGNKFAFLVGYHWTNPFGFSNLDLRTDYTRIEPFVYTHYMPINIYENYNINIGHWLEPNSDAFYLESQFIFSRDFTVNLFSERIRHGEGDRYTFHTPEMGTRKSFLAGIVEKKWRTGFSLKYQLFRDFFAQFQYQYITITHYQRIQNNSKNTNQLFVKLNMNW